MPLDITLFRADAGGNPELIKLCSLQKIINQVMMVITIAMMMGMMEIMMLI